MNKLLIVGISLFILLIIIGIIVYFLVINESTQIIKKKSKSTTTTTAANSKSTTKAITTPKPIDFSKGDTLLQEQELLSGVGLMSKNKKYTLVLQHDGNLVIYELKKAIWHSKTFGNEFKLKFEKVGSLNLIDTNGNVKWYLDPVTSITGGKLIMKDDGDLVMYDKSDNEIWSSKRGIIAYDYSKGDTLQQGSTLWYGQGLKSKNGKYIFVAQQDGNFVLYNENRTPTWATNTFVDNSIRTGNATTLQFRNDNTLKVYDWKSNEKWSLDIHELGGNSKLILQDDGNLVIYDSVSVPRWSSWYGINYTPKTWTCTKDGSVKGYATVNWHSNQDSGQWACNAWISECGNGCKAEKTNWECKVGDVSKGILEIGPGATASNTKFDAIWGCNTWKSDCGNNPGGCNVSTVNPIEYRKANRNAILPNTCPSGTERVGELCYPVCKAGFSGAISNCVKNCPSGFRDDGYYCAKPAPYGRGAGYPWRIGDWVGNYDGAKKRCEAENPQGCDMHDLIYYPKCSSGFHAFGCCTCTPDCEANSTDIGVSCKKEIYGRGAGTPLGCPSNTDNIVGLCYNNQ